MAKTEAAAAAAHAAASAVAKSGAAPAGAALAALAALALTSDFFVRILLSMRPGIAGNPPDPQDR